MTTTLHIAKRAKTTFVGSLKIQLRVIGALFMRDIIARFGREGLGFAWLFIQPMLFCVGVTIIWTLSMTQQGIIPVAAFGLTGYSGLVLFRGLIGRFMAGVSSSKGLLYHHNVKIIDLLYARGFMEFVACSVSLIFLTFVFAALGLCPLPDDPLRALAGWLFYAWFSFAAALVAAAMGSYNEAFERVAHILMYLSMPLTGGFVMVSWMPNDVQIFLLTSPLVNAMELFREGYFGLGVNAKYSVSYMFTVNMCLTLVGLIVVRHIRRKLIDD